MLNILIETKQFGILYFNLIVTNFFQDVNKSVRSILNKITPDNMIPLTERFKALPIDSYERLTKTIDLVFEKVMCFINIIYYYINFHVI